MKHSLADRSNQQHQLAPVWKLCDSRSVMSHTFCMLLPFSLCLMLTVHPLPLLSPFAQDDALLAYQIGFELVDNELQSFLGKVTDRLDELIPAPAPAAAAAAPEVAAPAAAEGAEGGAAAAAGGEAMETEGGGAAAPAEEDSGEGLPARACQGACL